MVRVRVRVRVRIRVRIRFIGVREEVDMGPIVLRYACTLTRTLTPDKMC